MVEDEALIFLDLETRLSTAGCEVIGPAATLELARRLVADAQFDAALVDANLAGHPVDELAIALTQRNVPFAFVTGYGRDVLPYGFREAVMLAKPFSQDQLLPQSRQYSLVQASSRCGARPTNGSQDRRCRVNDDRIGQEEPGFAGRGNQPTAPIAETILIDCHLQ